MRATRKCSFIPVLFGCALTAIVAQHAEAAARKLDFNRDIKPILSNRCFRCHGPDEAERKGGTDGLRLDKPEGALADLGGYAAIVPGNPDASELVKRVRSTDPDTLMPPPEAGQSLSPAEVELLSQWIAQGARYASHWSYVKPVRSEPPQVTDTAWPRGAVDRFVLARLEREGLRPAPEADRYTLIRRVSLDLTGLPPTVAEADAFVADTDPQAYEKLVDRLLARPSYGEYWAHLWLDLARYADSAGYADDPPRTIWMYRDYVIRSLNANKPFNQFTLEQIAGDLLPNPTEEQLVATAFHRNTLTNNEGGTNDEEFRNVAVVDRVNTTLAVWMGTTIACAQCHNHKYDPISQEEYFRLFAIFNNTEDADRGDEAPLLSSYDEQQKQQRASWEDQVARLQTTLRTPTPELIAAEQRWQAEFPLNLVWQTLLPTTVKSLAGSATRIDTEGSVSVAGGAKTDTYTVETTPAGTFQALRLEALADDTLPGKGPGHGGGNFVINRIRAEVVPLADQPLKGRFVRIELPGKDKMLSLAEVQVFRGAENIARQGKASQSSTDYGGDAARAIDGNTDGQYEQAKSTTHTASSENPWWEVDLQSEQSLERLVIWNRTDGGVGVRLSNFRVVVLDPDRGVVWEQTVAAPPEPSTELAVSGPRPIEFTTVVADYAQSGFDPQVVINNTDAQKGWAIGGQTGQSHWLILVPKQPAELAPGSKLLITIEQNSPFAEHTLGRFRLSACDDARALELARTPADVIEALRTSESVRSPEQRLRLSNYYASIAPELEDVRSQIAVLEKNLKELKPHTVPIMRERAGQRRVTHLQHRGNFLDEGQEVTPGTPAVFPPLPADAPPDRLALARWLVDENNPLTARVIANRYWEQIFGVGIVPTSEEFGSQGELPHDPELLDWLATELVESGWDLKALLRLLVTSAAYRQASRTTPELNDRDPENRLLARGPRLRLSAETVRDQALAVAGLLSAKMEGPPVKPPQPTSGLSAAFGSGIDWQTSENEDRHRRALYTTWRRSNPYPSMAAFDAPNREVCTLRRVRTNTPLQALVTLNDPVYIEAAQKLARRMVAEGGSSPTDRARFGFRACLIRPPQEAEVARLVRLYEQSLARLSNRPEEALKLANEPVGAAPEGVDVAELAAWTTVANVLLNLDESLMKP